MEKKPILFRGDKELKKALGKAQKQARCSTLSEYLRSKLTRDMVAAGFLAEPTQTQKADA